MQEELPKVNSFAITDVNTKSQNSNLFTRTPTWLHNASLSFLHNNIELGTNITLFTQRENQYLEKIDEVKQILETEMVHACDLAVPLIAEVKQGTNWYEAK